MSIYWLSVIPGLLWFSALLFQADRLNSRITANLFLLASLLCSVAGFALNGYHVFPEKGGFFVVLFSVPIIFTGIFEIFRLIYIKIRHEGPCINVRSGRWIGDQPVDGFYTTYPPNKLISGADILFGISQMMIPLVIVLVLFICSLALDW
jgi:hypothetical protein